MSGNDNPIYPKKQTALALLGGGQIEAARTLYEQICHDVPQDAEAWCALGVIHGMQKRFYEAVRCNQQAIAIQPDYGEAHSNLSAAYEALGRYAEAEVAARQALTILPNYADAHFNLGNALKSLGRLAEAEASYRVALRLRPDDAEVHYTLGNVLAGLERYDQAIAAYQRAIALAPNYVLAYIKLGDLYAELGNANAAVENFGHAMKLQPSNELRVKLAMVLPIIPENTETIHAWRNRIDSAITELTQSGLKLDRPVFHMNYFLAYHGLDNKDLHVKTARFYESACPSLLWTSPHCHAWKPPKNRIKIGFISKYMHNHSIGRTTRGILAKLSRDRFSVYALFVPPFIDDSISKFIKKHADTALVLPASLEQARKQIAALELDVLFYQDIGMEAFTYFLAFARLAPVQCVSFGHPDTTGIRNMDYFISNDLFEPENAQVHYSEKLVLLRDLGTLAYYYRADLPSPLKGRRAFGLSDQDHLYICPQTLFKLHPDFDSILADILRNDPLGRIVLIEGSKYLWSQFLKHRFQKTMPDVLSRIAFLPRQKHSDFVNLIAISDVMLDTIHFNGMNTSLEAFAVGTPLVTWYQTLQRGRHTYGMYRKMGIEDCVATSAQQYVDIALRLGTDKSFRENIRRKILSRSDVLYEDITVVQEFERFFLEATTHPAPCH